jgi:predicted Zn-dependent protease
MSPIRQALLATLIAMALALVACATNPVTGRSQFLIVPESQAISASRQAYTEMLAPLAKEGRINNDPAMVKRVKTITGRIVAQAVTYRPETREWDWTISVIDDPDTVNAFAMAGGKMAVYSGLITQIGPTDDELAQVIGHEIAHALSAHTAEKMSVALASDLAVTAFAVTQDRPGIALTGAALAAALAIKLPNSRQMETEADRIGIQIAAKAGYDPYAAASLWEKMKAVSGNDSSFDLLSTHPAPQNRINSLRALAPQMMRYYEAPGERPEFPIKTP